MSADLNNLSIEELKNQCKMGLTGLHDSPGEPVPLKVL